MSNFFIVASCRIIVRGATEWIPGLAWVGKNHCHEQVPGLGPTLRPSVLGVVMNHMTQ